MTIVPPDLEADEAGYELPDPGQTSLVRDRIVLKSGQELYFRYRLWQDRLIVLFTVGQIVRHNGEWVEVARIDTCHGTVHRHQLKKSRPDDRVGERHELEKIPAEDPWTVVDQWYGQALDMIETDWTEYLRRWRRG
jgi:hypothetical protein